MSRNNKQAIQMIREDFPLWWQAFPTASAGCILLLLNLLGNNKKLGIFIKNQDKMASNLCS